MIYKILNKVTGQFSNGSVLNKGHIVNGRYVKFSNAGKEFKTEKALKDHIVKAMAFGLWSANWEVIQITYTPTRPVEEWCDQNMLLKIMKLQNASNS